MKDIKEPLRDSLWNGFDYDMANSHGDWIIHDKNGNEYFVDYIESNRTLEVGRRLKDGTREVLRFGLKFHLEYINTVQK